MLLDGIPGALVSMLRQLQDTRAVPDHGQTLPLAASLLQDSELGTSRKEPAPGGMLLVGLVVGGNDRQGGLMLGVAGHGGVHGHSVSSWFLAAVSPSPASPTGSAPGRQ